MKYLCMDEIFIYRRLGTRHSAGMNWIWSIHFQYHAPRSGAALSGILKGVDGNTSYSNMSAFEIALSPSLPLLPLDYPIPSKCTLL
jgi:hypothetical protein